MTTQKEILLVDDEEIVRRMLTLFLSPFFKIYNAGNALDALEIIFGIQAAAFPTELSEIQNFLKNHAVQRNNLNPPMPAIKIKPDLIVADIKMPQINGIQLVRLIRNFLPETPIFMITGYDVEGYENEAASLRITEILSKPFSPTTLLDKIKALLHP